MKFNVKELEDLFRIAGASFSELKALYRGLRKIKPYRNIST
jgi:hypothetical protein